MPLEGFHWGRVLPRGRLQVDNERQVSERNVTRRMFLKHDEVMVACQVSAEEQRSSSRIFAWTVTLVYITPGLE